MGGWVTDRALNVWLRTAVSTLPGLGTVTAIGRAIRSGIVGVGFWVAVLLPITYVPFLVTGVPTQSHLLLLLGILCAHAVALVAGHGYGRESP